MSGLLKKVAKSTRLIQCQLIKRTNTSKPKSPSKKAKTSLVPPEVDSSSPIPKSVTDVQGLSKKIVDVPAEQVGPGASKQALYKNPEYFCYNNVSYFEAEVEMMKYRLPQPSNRSV